MADMQAPSLFGDSSAAGSPGRSSGSSTASMPMSASREANSLLDLLYDGFYMIFLLKNGYTPTDAESFRDRIRGFLTAFERGSKRLQTPAEDLYQSKFAFCALVDEVVLMSRLELREVWGRRPLQLEFFGEQLAGERFFDILEKLREAGAPKVQVLEIFHMCLLLGFQGKYILEGSEKLGYLTSRVGEEIAQHKGKRAAFAPHWAAPDRISHALRRDVPLWVIASVFALLGLLAFLGMRWVLDRQTRADLGPFAQIVKLAPQAAHVTITFP
jgi:type VI secretion system protein ImpK